MSAPPSRRSALAALLVLPAAACSSSRTSSAPSSSAPSASSSAPSASTASSAPSPAREATAAFAALERRYGTRIGVHLRDTASGVEVSHRADERFPMCSTFKALLAAVVLQQVPLDRRLSYASSDLVANSPITSRTRSLTVRELCDAAVRYSDNTAANVLLRVLGGPARLTAALRALGDDVTRLDRIEPVMSDSVPGDVRDTTTPRAMAATLSHVSLGGGLPPAQREVLVDWLDRNTTGDALVRTGVPATWRVGDKSGSGGYGTRNDIALLRPPGRAPLVLTVFTTKGVEDAQRVDAVVAQAAGVAVSALG